MTAQWDIYKVEYGERYGPLEVPDGFAPFAVLENRATSVDAPQTEAVVYFARRNMSPDLRSHEPPRNSDQETSDRQDADSAERR